MKSGRLSGKVALISGTAGAQGRAAALMFAAEGAEIVACDVDADGQRETDRLVRDNGGRITSCAPLDVSTAEGAEEWVTLGASISGAIDILYNNGSSPRFALIDELTADDWDHTMRNEIDIVWYCSRAAWPHLVRAEGAAIVNVASIAGKVGIRSFGVAAHGSAKAAVLGMTKQFAAEGASVAIRANCVSPGIVAGPATVDLIAQGSDGPFGPILAATPLGRAARPEEVAAAALFLASDEASYVTGAELMVDGGVTSVV